MNLSLIIYPPYTKFAHVNVETLIKYKITKQ